MRKIEHKGKIAFISEQEHKGLLKRFDLTQAKKERDFFVISGICFLCKNFFPSCRSCPLAVFETRNDFGCIYLIKHVLREENMFNFERGFIAWDEKDDQKARQQINKIYEAIKNLPRVKRRLKNEV